jgi:hypothetical protein
MKLTNIRNIGRFYNIESQKEFNIKKGRKKGCSIDILYYLHRGKRIIISDIEFNSTKFIKI